MAHLSFPQKIQLWWNASRLLAGMPVKAEFWDSLPSHTQSVSTETWKEWGLSPRDDGRYWLLAGLKKNEIYTLSGTYRLALLDVLMSEMSPEAQSYFINHNKGGAGTKAVLSLRPPLEPENLTHTIENIKDISPHDQLLIKGAAILAGDGDLIKQIPLYGDSINGEGLYIQNYRISWLMLAVLSSNANIFKHLLQEGLNPKIKIAVPEFFKNECQAIRDRWWKKLTEESRLSPRIRNKIASRWKERLPSFRLDYASSHACNIYASGILEVLIEGGYVSDVQDLYEKSVESNRFALLGVLAQKKSPLEITTGVGDFLKNWAKKNYTDDNQHIAEDSENASRNFLSKLSLLSDWNYDHKVFGDVVLYAAQNKKISPNFVQHLLEGGEKGVAQWWGWHWDEERYVLDEVFLNKNQAFLKGCANQGLGIHNLHRKCVLLALIIATRLIR